MPTHWSPKLVPGHEARIGGEFILIEQALSRVADCCLIIATEHTREIGGYKLLNFNDVRTRALLTSALLDYRKSFDSRVAKLDSENLFKHDEALRAAHQKFMHLANRYAAHSVNFMDVAAIAVTVGENENGEVKLGDIFVHGSHIFVSSADIHELQKLSEFARAAVKSCIDEIKSDIMAKAKTLSVAELQKLPSGFGPHVRSSEAISRARNWPKIKAG